MHGKDAGDAFSSFNSALCDISNIFLKGSALFELSTTPRGSGKAVGNSPAHPLAGGDAGHDDALGSWGGHSLESPLPKLLKEQLLLQLRPQRQRGAAGGKLERTRGLHLRTQNLEVLTRTWRSSLTSRLPLRSCPGTEARPLLLRVVCSRWRVSVTARLSAPES